MDALLEAKVTKLRDKFWKQALKEDLKGCSPEDARAAMGDLFYRLTEEIVPTSRRELLRLLEAILDSDFDFYVGPGGGNSFAKGVHLLSDVMEDVISRLVFARDPLIQTVLAGYFKDTFTPVHPVTPPG